MRLILNLGFFICALCSFTNLVSQTNFSVSGNAGLAALNDEFGNLIKLNLGIPIGEQTSVSLGYSYLQIESDALDYNLNQYSFLLEQFIVSKDDRFRVSGKAGPSLIDFNNPDDNNTFLGFDLGVQSSFKILGSFLIDLGLVNTFFKSNNIVQLYAGISFHFPTKNKSL